MHRIFSTLEAPRTLLDLPEIRRRSAVPVVLAIVISTAIVWPQRLAALPAPDASSACALAGFSLPRSVAPGGFLTGELLAGQEHLLRVPVSSPGVLTLEVVPLEMGTAPLLSTPECASPEAWAVRYSATPWRLSVEPGEHLFVLSGAEVSRPLGRYLVRVELAVLGELREPFGPPGAVVPNGGEDEEIIEIEPEGFGGELADGSH